MLTERQRRDLRRELRLEELRERLEGPPPPAYGGPLQCPAHGNVDPTLDCTCGEYRWAGEDEDDDDVA
jgi:hypothetical protein